MTYTVDMDLTQRLTKCLKPYVEAEALPIVVNLVKASVARSLPEPVDITAKYELDQSQGIYVRLTGDMSRDSTMLDHLSHFAEDQGYNFYYKQFRDQLKLDNTVIQ